MVLKTTLDLLTVSKNLVGIIPGVGSQVGSIVELAMSICQVVEASAYNFRLKYAPDPTLPAMQAVQSNRETYEALAERVAILSAGIVNKQANEQPVPEAESIKIADTLSVYVSHAPQRARHSLFP